MSRATVMLALLFLAVVVLPAQSAILNDPDPHIRSTDPVLVDALVKGSRLSPTLQHLIERIDASDVVVYVMFDRSASSTMAGHLSFITTAGGRRYLRVSIDRRNAGAQLVAILGHELQHAVEIAESPTVTDAARVLLLYQRIGFQSAAVGVNCFDSAGAILAGRMVQQEALRVTRP
jgi:hypothetical protein